MASIIWESLVSIGDRSQENFADNRFALLFIYIDTYHHHYHTVQVAICACSICASASMNKATVAESNHPECKYM